MQQYTVNYNIDNQDHKAYLVLSSSEPYKKDLDEYEDFETQHNYPANVAYQVEFNQLDELLTQTLGTSYQKISEYDGIKFIAESLESWLSFFNIIPRAYAGYGYIFPDGNKYLAHKFSFKIQDNEYDPNETSPKRIEYIQFTWKGVPQRTYYNYYYNRYAKLYVWKNNDWEKLDTEKWRWWQDSNDTLTFKINNDIENYLDADHKIHFLVEPNEKGYNVLATDFVDLEIQAFGYREGFE